MHPKIHAYLSEKLKANEAGAAVAVVKNGEVIHRQGYGLANMEWGIPNSPETVFRLASISKQFTAVAIMMLLEQGKLSLEDSISKFFPDFSTSGHHVTVRHLLNHSSGIKSNTSMPEFETFVRTKLTAQELYEKFAHLPFDFAPGEKFLYNNSGYHLLGMIIEKVSGQSYEDFLRQHIFEPLEMHSACYLHNEPIVRKRASGYALVEGKLINSPFIDMSIPFAAGALGASVDDLVKWDKALRENRLLSSETLSQMHQPTILKDGSSEAYGFGWGVVSYQDYPLVLHSGGINGFGTYMLHHFESRTVVVVLCNNTSLNSEGLALACFRQAMDIPEPTYPQIKLSAEEFACVEGQFLMDGQELAISFQAVDGELVSPEFYYSSPFRPYSQTEFYSLKNPDVTLIFEDNFSSMTLRLPFRSFKHKRKEVTA